MVQSVTKEYLFEFSKINISLNLEKFKFFFREYKKKYKENKLKNNMKIFNSNTLLTVFLLKNDFTIDVEIFDVDKNYAFRESPTKHINEFMFEIEISSITNIVYYFLEDLYGYNENKFINELERELEQSLITEFTTIKKSYIIKDEYYWIDLLFEKFYLIRIINITDFYNLIGRHILTTFHCDSFRGIFIFKMLSKELGIQFLLKYNLTMRNDDFKEFILNKNKRVEDLIKKDINIKECIQRDHILFKKSISEKNHKLEELAKLVFPDLFEYKYLNEEWLLTACTLYAIHHNLFDDKITKNLMYFNSERIDSLLEFSRKLKV